MSAKVKTLQTRATLLQRVKDPSDEASWKEFHDLYRPLMLALARHEGLGEADAEDVAQETFRALAAALPSYNYDPHRARFKKWLCAIIDNRLADYFRRRDGRTHARARALVRERPSTAVLESVAAPEPPFDDVLEGEWRRTLMLHALAELSQQVTTKTYQIVYLLVQGKSPGEVAKMLGLSRGRVYLAKHRIEPKLRRLIKELEVRYG